MMISLHDCLSSTRTEPILVDDTKVKRCVSLPGNTFSIESEERRCVFHHHDSLGTSGRKCSHGILGHSYKQNGNDKRNKDDKENELLGSRIIRRHALTLLRMLVLDASLLLVVGMFCFLVWVEHVHEHFLIPQIDAAKWTLDRATKEMTYYNRICSELDLSTTRKEDLFLSDAATPQDAYQHQLRHGFTVFPSVLSEETATNLRDYIVSKNSKLSESESNFVIAKENRYSFNLGMEEPSVSRAAMELTSNHLLKKSVEKIMGTNPALLEMTAITSSHNAKDQYWHSDVIPMGSATQFGRSFAPAYSLFIMLQNTTKAMGATCVCPGLYMCSGGELKQVCEKHGFQLVGEDGYYRAGDALLMNMNRYDLVWIIYFLTYEPYRVHILPESILSE